MAFGLREEASSAELAQLFGGRKPSGGLRAEDLSCNARRLRIANRPEEVGDASDPLRHDHARSCSSGEFSDWASGRRTAGPLVQFAPFVLDAPDETFDIDVVLPAAGARSCSAGCGACAARP